MRRTSAAHGLVALAARHRMFCVLLAVGSALRLVTVLGYSPALLYNDAFEYVAVALHLTPYPERPIGYSFLLRALEPAHSFLLVAVIQHLMGLAIAVCVYVVVRRFGLPWWAGCLGAAPILFDAFEIELEQMILSDTLFTLLVVVTIVLALRTKTPGVLLCGTMGLLLACIMITRPAGLPVIAALTVYLLIRRVRLRAIGLMLAALAVPLLGYGLWYSSAHGAVALDSSTGIQLYGRVGGFADCRKIKPPARLAVLCPPNPGNGLPAPAFVWWSSSPLVKLPGPTFTAHNDKLASSFAIRAILAQPGDYLHAVGVDTLHAFAWSRGPYPNAYTASGWTFSRKPWPLPKGGLEEAAMTRYERGDASTRVVQPWADIMIGYQKVMFLRGPFLAALVLIGVAGLFPKRRDGEAASRLPLAFFVVLALGLALTPILTVQLDYRYLMPSYPFMAMGAALGAARLASRRRVVPPAAALPDDVVAPTPVPVPSA